MGLIWVGNTLYPSWFVFGVAGFVILAFIFIFVWQQRRGTIDE